MISEKTVYEVLLPCKELRDFVSHFWCSKWNPGATNRFTYHATASTTSEFVFAFCTEGEQKMKPLFSSVQGHSARHDKRGANGVTEMFGMALYSHAIPFVFGYSAASLLNQFLDFREIVTADATLLEDRLAAGGDFRERVALMTAYLMQRLHSAPHSDIVMLDAIMNMREKRGQVSIRSFANEHALSQKQFERRFRDFTGFNPKLYARILRFESFFSKNAASGLTNLALDLGYYDQAHFNNEFKLFSGYSPRRYVPIVLA